MAETRRKFDADFRRARYGWSGDGQADRAGGPGPGDQRGDLGNRVNADGLRRAAVPEWVSLLPDECRPPIGVGAAGYASG